MAVQPKFLVLDEPISALDVSIQAQIVNLLRQIQHEQHLTYLFIAHDLSMVHYISDKIVVMYQGRIVEAGDTDAIYHHPLYPYTQTLLASVPQADPMLEQQKPVLHFDRQALDPTASLVEAAPAHWVLAQ
ncbi:Oligopeptide transport ATP-binding protein OppF [Lacticaseibacillus paracasei subsp. paracasei CNCM I-4270]|uniref:Oligopeptide transport ATP-binding protein OppF n=1 Tax=Lacticaseibacillus paracasei subsp. paracasei CNCM I-4270 TaxID=1256202 RepID=A0A8E0M966_LACPA|nr:Oligopeptide transport ATP-binding protein OppF [Lacticaseibacillus paracasei subsp. paracasei CNCM I-4270]